MKILLTGAQGQVGWELQRSLALLGPVHAVGRAELDLSDAAAIRRLMREVRPTVVVNAAAWSTRGAACRCTLSCAAPASLPACPLHPIRCLQRPWALTRTCLRMAWT